MAKLLTHHITLKENSDELEKAGDYCVRESVPLAGKEETVNHAIILKCPFCSLDMMSTSVHKIFFKREWWREMLLLPGVGKINVLPMLQCPYGPEHKFFIKNGKVKPVYFSKK